MSRTVDPRQKSSQTVLRPRLAVGAQLLQKGITEAPREGGTSSTENPGLRALARMIARTILGEGLTREEVPVSLGDKNDSG